MTNATAISRSRVWSVLTTPAAIPQTGPRLKTNLDTDLLKLIAIAAMLIDHIGGAFFPEVGVFRWIGRLAFPIFCYCLTVGLLYTHDVRKYLTRLGIFALVSQPFYILAFHPVGEFWANLTNWNIFFTLFLSLLGMYGLKERKWWLFALAQLRLLRHRHPADADLLPLPEPAPPGRGPLPPQLSSGPDERLAGGSPVPDGGRPLYRLVHFRRVRRAPDLLRHALPHQDQPLVLLRLLSRPSGGHRPGGEYPVRQKGRVLC